ncbi:hypothetical protein G7B40_040605 [Aetokthonos hydrillicola Thurmond2011]|uniref:Uncharacterized protein n=1 Tax=Aetokthonos hydrillicola Thurmond2011 TaxID=2712845 RepID=A0AAP5IFI9_9CYAN|nr:hypothetical protein [Aetokthonos hydrillicola]MDR9900791.1 hypothetical protein [Aetokthonos hydrillicola Thurmond2011]
MHSSYKLEATADINIDELLEIADILKSKLQETIGFIASLT